MLLFFSEAFLVKNNAPFWRHYAPYGHVLLKVRENSIVFEKGECSALFRVKKKKESAPPPPPPPLVF